MNLYPRIHKKLLADRVRYMGKKLAHDYQNKRPTLVPVLTGAFIFGGDILRHMDGESQLESRSTREMLLHPMTASSYVDNRRTGAVQVSPGLDESMIRDRDVIVVDDIYDTGHTLKKLQGLLESMQPRSIQFVVLIAKEGTQKVTVELGDVGFHCEDFWAVGYGMDDKNRYRGLRYIAELAEKDIPRRIEPGGPL